MEPTRYALAVASLALGLGTSAWFFDDPVLLASATVLAVFLVYRAAVFLEALRHTTGGLTVVRETDNLIVRQGAVLSMRLTAEAPVRKGTHLSVQEELPRGAVLRTGRTGAAGAPARDRTEVAVLAYGMVVMNAGGIGFPGLTVRLKDPFFSAEFLDSRRSARLPILHVEPAGQFLLTGSGGFYGQTEEERRPLIRGYGIRGFRAYLPGDDPRTIDWKLSAKHDRLFVREYTGITSAKPFFVADLPDAGVDFPEDSFQQLRSALYDAIMAGQRESVNARVLLISGPNIVAFHEVGVDAASATRVLAAMVPVERLHHLYRLRGDAGTRVFQRKIARLRQEEVGGGSQYLNRLGDITGSFGNIPVINEFERQLARVLRHADAGEVYLFSLFSGDQSHARELVVQSGRYGMKVHAIAPRGQLPEGTRRRLEEWGIAGARVVG